MRNMILLIVVLAIGVGAYLTFRDGGFLDRVTEDRVEAALIANGAPENLASCMAPKLVDELTIEQLLKLERLGAQAGEERVLTSADAALERVRRVDDPEAVRALAQSGTTCGIEILRENIEGAFEALQ